MIVTVREDDFPKAGQDELLPLRGDLPGPQHPLPPSCHRDQQCAPAGFTRGVDVKRPAIVGLERGFDFVGAVPMKPRKVRRKPLREFAHLAGGDSCDTMLKTQGCRSQSDGNFTQYERGVSWCKLLM